MKKRTYKIIAIITILLLLSGCTKYVVDADGKAVTDEATGMRLTQNILCQPTSEDVKAQYNEIDVDLIDAEKQNVNDLPLCKDFTINDGGYEGLWTSVLVKPLAWVVLKIGGLVNNYGLALIIAGLLIRLAMYPITKKTAEQSELMKKAKPELDKLEKKYKGKIDKESQTQKSTEMMAIYKKYNVNPVNGCITAFIQMPLFLAFYEAINRVPAIFEGTFLGLKLGITPWFAIQHGMYLYILINIIVVASTFFSFKMTSQDQAGQSAGQMKMMMYMMVVMIAFASFTLPVAIGLYWITSTGFTVVQNLIVKRGKKDGNK